MDSSASWAMENVKGSLSLPSESVAMISMSAWSCVAGRVCGADHSEVPEVLSCWPLTVMATDAILWHCEDALPAMVKVPASQVVMVAGMVSPCDTLFDE